MYRIQYAQILKDLNKKLVLLVGPRQAGKTWLAKSLAKAFRNSVYLNYDIIAHKTIILKQSWLPTTDLLILDELHKMPDWKNYLKGVYDGKPETMRLLVTGSARLDVYDRIGDSLAGRYLRHRLLPFSLAELKQINFNCSVDKLIERGGFPEPLSAPNNIEAKRWRQQYINSLLSTDVFDIDVVKNIKALRLVFDLLRNKVGSPVSYNSIAEDVSISPTTVTKYIQILEALYIIFIVTPFSQNIARSILKEPKIYFFDNGLVTADQGAKLENMVANCLLKNIYAKNDYLAEEYKLHYLRTKDGIEVDFAIAKEQQIENILEVKNSDHTISKSLKTYHTKYNLPAIQLVNILNNEVQVGSIQVLDLEKYLAELFV